MLCAGLGCLFLDLARPQCAAVPGPKTYVKRRPKNSKRSQQGHGFTLFWGPGSHGTGWRHKVGVENHRLIHAADAPKSIYAPLDVHLFISLTDNDWCVDAGAAGGDLAAILPLASIASAL